jgi:putative transposase
MERFNRSKRREFFNAYLFDTLLEVKIMIREWVYDYNNYRPHLTLGKLSPIEYLDKYNLDMNYSV